MVIIHTMEIQEINDANVAKCGMSALVMKDES